MAITSVEAALLQLEACRSDFKLQVRDRRAQAREQLAAATETAKRIRDADAEAMTFLQAVMADPETPKALVEKLRGDVAFHRRVKQDQAAEE